MASNNKQGGGGIKAADHDPQDEEIDPKFEWLDNANSFLLRLTLTGFKKEDFRVQVDGKGRLTVRGQRSSPGAGGGSKQQNNNNIRFHKVFQLPSNANIEDITGRFEANVLTITVPKRPSSTVTPPATVEEIKQHATKQQQQQEDDEAKKKKKLQEEEEAKKKKQLQEEEEDTARKKKKLQDEEDEAKKKVEEELQLERKKKLEEDEARKKAQQKKKQEEEGIMAKRSVNQEQKPTERKEQANVADRESLAEKVKRRAEEERAKAAAAAEERTATALSGWRERVAGELEKMRWAEGAVEAVRKNKEVIATAVAAFSIGFFLSQKIFSRR